jgi:HEAT repeat protein
MDDAGHLLDAVVEDGTDADVAAWVATGRDGLLVLRNELMGGQPRQWQDVHPKDAIDGLSAAVAAIAAEHPGAFLDLFADRQFDENGFVLIGLGQIDDPRATERLAAAARSRSNWTRMDAAIGLGRRPATLAVDALMPLLQDLDYLVRFHALRSLGAVGDARALRALTAFHAPSEVEANLANEAVQAIARRLKDQTSTDSSDGPRSGGIRER